MMLRPAGALPGAPRRAARREAAGDADGVTTAQRNVGEAACDEIASRRDESVAVEERGCAIDRERLDDAVEIELQAGAQPEDRPDPPEAPAAGRRAAAGSSLSRPAVKSLSYPAATTAAPTHGSTSPAVCSDAQSATSRASRNSMDIAPPPAAFSRTSSAAGRNRLNTRS